MICLLLDVTAIRGYAPNRRAGLGDKSDNLRGSKWAAVEVSLVETSGQLAPLRSILARHKIKQKTWEDLVEAKFISPAQRISNTTQYGLDNEQLMRLGAIAAARKRVHGRYTLSALAFELAREGQAAPSCLAKDALRQEILGAHSRIKRTFQRYLGLTPDLKQVTDAKIRAAVETAVRKVIRKRPTAVRLHDLYRLALSMLLRMMYLGGDTLGYARQIKEALTPIVHLNDPELGGAGMPYKQILDNSTQIASLISFAKNIVNLDPERNAMLLKLKTIPDDDFQKAFVMWQPFCTLVWNAVEGLKRSFPLLRITKRERETFDALLLGAIVASYDNRNPTEVQAELLGGSSDTASHAFGQLVTIVQLVPITQRLIRERKEKRNARKP